MRKSKFTDEQIVRALRDADATSTAAAAKKIGVSEQTLYFWRRKFWDASVDCCGDC
jgi:putative transposase